jgi:hypothetical protein
MEVILNDKSKAYERITLEDLLQFIKTNFSTFQRPSEIITVDKVDTLNNETNDKSSTDKLKKKLEVKSFYDELATSVSNVKFNSNLIKSFSNFPETPDHFVFNMNNFLIETNSDTETEVKKIDFSKFTFFKSVLFNLLKTPKPSDLENFIKTLVKHISYGGITEFNYTKMKWNKKTLKDNINKNIIDAGTIRVVNDYLHINIFIFNEDSGQFEYGGGDFIPFKMNIFLYKYKGAFYPVFTKNSKHFAFDSPLVKYFLTNSDKITLLSQDQLTFKEEDLSSYINLSSIMPDIPVAVKMEETSVINKFEEDFTEDNNSSSESESKDEVSESEDDDDDDDDDESTDKDEIMIEKYMKLSLMELQKEAKKFNIDIKNGTKLKPKKDLCCEIVKLKKSS